MDIDKNIKLFVEGKSKNKGRKPGERYASFDYCFNYFQSFKEDNNISAIADSKHIQNSCVQLAFYLASWGMLRGSSFLLEKSSKFYEPLIAYIAGTSREIWNIDADNYTKDNIKMFLKCKDGIRKALGCENNPTDTLITKIMLGVFANIPAFDNFFKKAFSLYYCDEKALLKIANFYEQNKTKIDSYHICTFDFNNGSETTREYTKAKLIDMIGFIEGQRK